MWLKDIKADLSCLEVNVRMVTLGYHFDFGSLDRIVLTNLEVELEPAVLERRVRWSPDISNPLVEVVLYWLD